jgi:hypothetical protein
MNNYYSVRLYSVQFIDFQLLKKWLKSVIQIIHKLYLRLVAYQKNKWKVGKQYFLKNTKFKNIIEQHNSSLLFYAIFLQIFQHFMWHHLLDFAHFAVVFSSHSCPVFLGTVCILGRANGVELLFNSQGLENTRCF